MPARRSGRPPSGGNRRWLPTAACASLLAAASACTAAGGAPAHRPTAAVTTPSRLPFAARPASAPVALRVAAAAYQLPAGISREVVLPVGRDLLIVGGLTQRGTTTRAVTRLEPVTGRTRQAGRLASPSHDAAGAVLGGRAYLFGGGVTASVAAVQALRPGRAAAVAGQLPGPRSDLSSVLLGRTAYLIGGYDGASYDRGVLATSDGHHFRTVARLPVPVRYPAVAGMGGRIWVFGGEVPAGATGVIQQIDLTTGKAAVVGHLPAPVTGAAAFTLGGHIYLAGGQVTRHGRQTISDRVLSYSPGHSGARPAGRLPVAVSNAAAAVVGGTAFVVGGNNGHRQVPTVTEAQLTAAPAALPPAGAPQQPGGTGSPRAGGSNAAPATGRAASGPMVAADTPDSPDPGAASPSPTGITTGSGGSILASQPWLLPPHGRGHLRPGSDPSVLPGDVLIADHGNNRLLIVDPRGRVRWKFPRPGDLAPGQTFLVPDDAFFSPNGKDIIATEEDDQVVSVISIARHKIVYRYGTPGVPGAGPNHLSNPDDAMMMPGGALITADIRNCRVLLIPPPWRQPHRPLRVIGGTCGHGAPQAFASPNGAFPLTNGHYLVTEINGDWAEEITLHGRRLWATHPPGVVYPSDTNEVCPGRYLTADYSAAGQVVEFNSHGRLLWRFGGLNYPSLALPLPNGDILVNDDYNNRVIVIDPTTNRIVWQYGHTGVAGKRPGYLNDPDGVDVTPPNSLLITHAPTMGHP